MNSHERHLKLHELWKQDFFGQFDDDETFARTFTMGTRISITQEKKSLAAGRRLDSELIRFFKRVKIDAENPDWIVEEAFDVFPESRMLRDSAFNRSVVESLISAFQANRKAMEDIQGRIKFALYINHRGAKRGPTRQIHPYLAELFLIGFEVQKGSAEGTETMLDFLEGAAKGDPSLATWLRRRGVDPSELLYPRGNEKDSANKRADSIKNYFTKAAVSKPHKTVVKRINDPEVKPAVKALRNRVNSAAAKLLAKLPT